MRRVSTEEKLSRIHNSATQLIERREATDISIYDVAKECGMATSTVYHHYPNIEELFHHLLDDVFEDFDFVLENCVEEQGVTHWSDINRMIETGFVRYYEKNAVAQKLILGRHTFSDITHADVENDLLLGKRVEQIYHHHFQLPSLPSNINIFAIALQVADKVYSLSYREHGCIKKEMADEAIRLTQAYLGLYLPSVCLKNVNQPTSPLNSQVNSVPQA
ncbi:TetR/AcrR family transcriptional regulator [Vibrio agarivorans]|uniref:TetR/AcrR family transcriptional regulator n=1 Tax=Vibrio agarivorans TaxID=153622 RepID=A0ABT7Y4B3_9VIBR|nr:TetR/AcrR family transcriptional regulator [Vibrio agarivorans]MDN2482892.1 TetR/AcrR family transcriptional regulator [Vibrio agarivorans]